MVAGGLATVHYLIWATTSIFLLLATLVVLWGAGWLFTSNIRYIEERHKLAVANIEKRVLLYMEPSTVVKETREEMRALLLPEMDDFFTKSSEQEIVILGADQLRPTWTRFNELQEKSVNRQLANPIEKIEYQYGLVFNKILARSSDKLLLRYIYLFRPQDLQGRTKGFRDAYLRWLNDQKRYFEINESYTIIDTPRATVWGAPKSIIFFRNHMVEVFFSGGGVVVTSKSGDKNSVVRTARRFLIDEYVHLKVEGLAREEYSQTNISAFDEYIEKIRKEVEQA